MLDTPQQETRVYEPSFVTFVLTACVAQCCVASLLVGGLFIGSGPNATVRAGLELTIGTSAFVCGLSVLAAVLVVTRQLRSPTATLVAPLRFGAPLATFAIWGLSLEDGDPGAASLTFIDFAVPVAALGWAAALLVAVILRQSLVAHLLRHQRRSGDRADTPAAAPRNESLSNGLGRVGGNVALAISLVVLAMLLAHVEWTYLESTPAITALVTFLVVGSIGLGYASGRFFGEVYARTLLSVTTRFELLASDSVREVNQPLRTPVVEAFGGLVAELERLRIHLTEEISTYEQALEKTRIADQAKEQFLAAVSHELRTPLNSICGFAHLMLEEPEGSLTPAQREDLRLVRAGGHQLLALIDDIVDVTMVETGEFSLSLEEEDLVPRIREIVSIHRPLVHDKAIQLEFYVRGESRPILCDGRRIGQVITNLLSNAIKFTEEGSVTVSCDLESEDDFMTIEIKDTGVGISNDGLTIIFEAYKQVGEIQQRTRGTGLGLAISRAVVERHGGEIWATSSVGEGSTFFARLPRSGPPPASPEVAIREEKELDG